jgi:hypothetical protein
MQIDESSNPLSRREAQDFFQRILSCNGNCLRTRNAFVSLRRSNTMNREADVVIAGVGLDRRTRKSHWPARLDFVQRGRRAGHDRGGAGVVPLHPGHRGRRRAQAGRAHRGGETGEHHWHRAGPHGRTITGGSDVHRARTLHALVASEPAKVYGQAAGPARHAARSREPRSGRKTGTTDACLRP